MTKLIKKSPKRQVLFEKIQGEIACDSPRSKGIMYGR